MNARREPRVLLVEDPDTTGIVDFVGGGVTVTVRVGSGKVYVKVCCSHGEGSSSWDEHETSWDLPANLSATEVSS